MFPCLNHICRNARRLLLLTLVRNHFLQITRSKISIIRSAEDVLFLSNTRNIPSAYWRIKPVWQWASVISLRLLSEAFPSPWNRVVGSLFAHKAQSDNLFLSWQLNCIDRFAEDASSMIADSTIWSLMVEAMTVYLLNAKSMQLRKSNHSIQFGRCISIGFIAAAAMSVCNPGIPSDQCTVVVFGEHDFSFRLGNIQRADWCS